MMTSIYSRCSTWQGPASLRQCDFPVKGISHRVYLCVHMHASSSHVHVFIRTTDYAEHCCRPEERKERVAGGPATSLITKQTTAGHFFYTINSCRPLKGFYSETFLFSISLQLNVTSTIFSCQTPSI